MYSCSEAFREVLERSIRNDTATSFSTIAKALKFDRITSSVMSKDGFNLRKCDSNDEAIKRI